MSESMEPKGIQRWHLLYPQPIEDDANGEWIRYEDHIAAVQEAAEHRQSLPLALIAKGRSEAAHDALRAIELIHTPSQGPLDRASDPDWYWCESCHDERWPCPTLEAVRALLPTN